MFRKVMLFLGTLAIVGVAFAIYQWRDEAPLIARHELTPEERVPLREHSSQPSDEGKTFKFREAEIPPGQAGRVRVFDNKGNVTKSFEWSKWNPVSDTRFHMSNPFGRVLLPGGQLAYVWADEGEIEIAKSEGNNFNPRKGWLKGHVRVFIDRSKPEWREAHPDQIEPEQHPEMLVKMWLDDVDFDMDLGRIESQGPILVQSAGGNLRGTGLELSWNESTRQIKLLRIIHGDRAQIRRSGVMDFGIGDETTQATPGVAPPAAGEPGQAVNVPVSDRKSPKGRKQRAGATDGKAGTSNQKAAVAKREEQLQFRSLEEEQEELRKPKEDRIDTYRIEFHDGVMAEQKELARSAGRLKAALLQLTCDIGRAEREDIQHAPDSQPADGKPTGPAADTTAQDLAEAGPDSVSYVEVQWTGELVAVPQETRQPTTNPTEGSKGEKFHLVAMGSPVEVFDRQSGHATCQKLEYHAEDKRVWLKGSTADPARVVQGDDRQLIGETVFFDRQAGIARIEGPGRMVDAKRRKEKDVPACLADLAKEMAQEEQQDVGGADIKWTLSAVVEFGMSVPAPGEETVKTASAGKAPRSKPPKSADAATGMAPGAYLKHAVFEGQVDIHQPGSLINSDHVEAFFQPPQKSADPNAERTIAMDRLVATGNVHMVRGQAATNEPGKVGHETNSDDVTCDRLEVEMTTDDTGRNVPKVGRAFGHPVAKRVAGRATREIRAADHLEIYLASKPRPVTPQERQRLELAARRCDFAPGSAERQAMETRLERRRRIVTTQLKAMSAVSVVMNDPSDANKDANIHAEQIDCSLQDNEDISKALVVGREDDPAEVKMGDIYAKGPRITLDMTTQSMEVPGAGRMSFLSKQDLAGRPVDRPVPVVVDWTDGMWMHGQENKSSFRGTVHAVSSGTTLDCSKELSIEFQNLPDTTTQPAAIPLDQRWILRPILGRGKSSEKDASPASRLARQMHKKPSYLHAIGDAVIVSAEYAKPVQHEGPFKMLMDHIIPTADTAQPAALPPPALRGPLVSRFRAVGPRIGIDLVEEHFGIEGPGNLSIEDYRPPSDKPSTAAPLGQAATAAIGGFDSTGPSQTLFTWESSMTYLNKRDLAQFDGRVEMDHFSGDKIKLGQQLLNSLQIDPKRLKNMKSRQAHLSCDNLLVEFIRNASRKSDNGSPLSGVTQVKTFEAKGQVAPVTLDMDEGRQSVKGMFLKYTEASGDLSASGSADAPAQVLEQDERTGKMRVTKAEPIVYNLKTHKFSMKEGTVR